MAATAQVFLQVVAASKEELRTEVGLLIGQDPYQPKHRPVSIEVNGMETFAEVTLCILGEKEARVSLTIAEVVKP